jgi:hypothetical protein
MPKSAIEARSVEAGDKNALLPGCWIMNTRRATMK